MGKGFAVVANEVKELAKQTSQATDQVRSSIEKMKLCSDGTNQEVLNIGEVIDEVNEIVVTIAGAIEEQTITVKNNSLNTSQVAEGVREVSDSVSTTSVNMSEIVEHIQDMSNKINEVAQSCEQTSQNTNSVLGRIQSIGVQVDHNNSSTSQISTASKEMESMADDLSELVSRFTLKAK